MKLPVAASQLDQLLSADMRAALRNPQPAEIDGVYDHWDHVRQLPPPDGLSHREWWFAIKIARTALGRRLPLKDKRGEAFNVSIASSMQRRLHFLDREAAGAILGADVVSDNATKRRFLVRSLIEE